MKKIFLFIFLLMGLTLVSVFGQSKRIIADKIVGQVGDKIILRSDITNAMNDAKRQTQGQENVVLPSECQILESQFIRKALVLQAQKDSLHVSEDDIEASLDNQIRQSIQAYGSKDILEEIAGKSVYQIKEDFKESFRDVKLAEQMQNKIVDAIKITPTEVKAFFNKIPKDSLAFYESEIEVSQIIIHPKANKDVEEYIAKQLNDYKKQAEKEGSKKFDQLAKLYSEDPAVKENGGQYSLNRNEKSWDAAFLAGAFRLKEGQISSPIKSKFGLHIILMVSRSGDEAVVKHILRIPPVTDEEIAESIKLLDTVKNKLIAGSITFGAAVNKYSDDENSKFSAGSVASGRGGSTFVNIDQLDKDMVKPLSTLKPGGYSAPQVYVDERGRKLVRLIYLKNRTEPHRENLKEDYNRISQRAIEEKKTIALESWFKEHIPTYFISIDKEFGNCKGLEEWRHAADLAEKTRK